MSRTLRLAAVAVAIAGVVAPLSAASASPDPLCKLYWYEKPSVEVNPGSENPVTVNPGRAGWVC